MRVAIIDDERLARNELRRLLDAHPEVDVVAEAACVADGLHAIRHMAPDLVFLDIQMPDGSGFDLLSALEQAPPAVIFTTAHDQFALKAFDANALDYLLKPIEAPRLAQALQKRSRDAGPKAPKPNDGKVFMQDGERCWFVDLEQIALFESEGNYTRVYFDNNRPLLLRSLTLLEERLDPQHFMRVNRRHIVNLRFVRAVGPSPAGGLVLQLEGGLNVDMSRRRAVQFKQLKRL
ncbi:MAG: response regulator transcription factor [Pseudoduganella sp.]|jgi:two-component system LytT family response regulator|nr:response regulator transcription factor [Pseudoduganella sp.]